MWTKDGSPRIGGLAAVVMLAAALLCVGCGSDSKAGVSFPPTPTAPALQRLATPVPTATALP